MALEPLQKESLARTPVSAPVHHGAEPDGGHAPAVDPGRLYAGSTSALVPASAPHSAHEQNPIHWGRESRAPADPFELFEVDLEAMPPARREEPTGPMRSEPRSAQHHAGHHRSEHQPLVPEKDFPDWDEARRQKYWAEFDKVCREAHKSHATMGQHLTTFRHVKADRQLRALGFHLPNAWRGNIAELTDQQQVPFRGGATVGSLFDGNNDARLDKHDQRAIDNAGQSMNNGRGTIETKALHTLAADAAVKKAINDVSAAAGDIRSGLLEVRAAIEAIKADNAGNQAAALRSDVERLQKDANGTKELVDILFGLVTTSVYATTGDIGDAVNQIGVTASTILGHVNDEKLADTMSRIDLAEQNAKTATRTQLGLQLSSARSSVMASHRRFAVAGHDLEHAMSERRHAYNALAISAGAEIRCPEKSRHKIAGMLAAIPLVEIVVSRAQMLGSMEAPAHNDAAARGLGMAAYHGLPIAGEFRRACGELNYMRTYARGTESDWTERLHALLDVKTRIIGRRPGDDR
ncbi:MAG: hypothetical protein JWP01_3020 [Myxococcales bacterium]|nr:hypothetical protein [Myxococcales bacterium]